MKNPDPDSLTRRSFRGQSAAILGGTALASGFPSVLRGALEDKKLKIALVGLEAPAAKP